eukprot:CAMPEP_0174719698 /NCGR_PEP_ID=MMETSP1094-20130205/31788_1 /TAXON_ID=156173 /ORGANISM="Chrysochromulina brevifilum, Strain UTEX LB 985" /LENGTH=63 /DNA_ID=CAMNT_0015920051 /DNA_START=454 /DNA_END=642 /DNA_ORIENTATION=-
MAQSTGGKIRRRQSRPQTASYHHTQKAADDKSTDWRMADEKGAGRLSTSYQKAAPGEEGDGSG